MPVFLAGQTLPAWKLDDLGGTVQQELTTSSSAHTGDALTDMALNNVPAIAGDLYAIHLHTRVRLSAATGAWNLACLLNGSTLTQKIGEFGWVTNQVAALQEAMIDGIVWWTPSVTASTDDIAVFADEATGTAELTLIAAVNTPRTLTLINMNRL